MKSEWVGIAANAHSGRGQGRRRVEALASHLSRLGLEARIAWTPAARTDLVAVAARDDSCRCLVAAGGDGTVAALINEAPSRPIAVLPAGTENLFARHFGMRGRPREVAETISRGAVTDMDLGLVAGRRFALMAGIGFDADVVTRHHAARLGRSGAMRPTHRAAYVEPVLRASFGYRFPALQIRAEGPDGVDELTGTSAFLFNLPRYALGLPFAPTARGDDGLLDLVVFRNAGALQALRYLWMVFRGLHLKREGVWHRRVSRATVEAAQKVPVQLDGDPGGAVSAREDDTPWCAEVLPAALQIVVPRRFASVAVTA